MIVDTNSIGNIYNVLFNHFGVCKGIAASTTVLLNNPELNVNIRDVFGCEHVWNVIKIDNKYYYLDNTWNITRNPNKYNESLKAKSFYSNYLLFESNMATDIGFHDPETYAPEIEKENYDKDIINKKIKKLEYIAKYSNYSKPVFESRFE